ncbi:hypothetical protein VDGD_01829 [Verticillium dahliae]|nr:hypothetical protein VdG1_07304 [Verticillium dahliae VDG1]RBQ72028.1 hypothetical protein VDGD_01829 [Verticillium dahliae]
MATNIEFENAIRNAMLSDLGLSRNDELPMENFHDRKITYDPGRRASRAVGKTANSAWKAVGEKGIDDEEARSVQGLADLGGGRMHAAQHDTESRDRSERLKQINNRPRPQQVGALSNITNFGGLDRPGVPVKVFAPKNMTPSKSANGKKAAQNRPDEQNSAKKNPENRVRDDTKPDLASARVAAVIAPHLRTKAQAAEILSSKNSPKLQSVSQAEEQISDPKKQAQSQPQSPHSTVQETTQISAETQEKPAKTLDRSSGRVLWTWSTDCKAKIAPCTGLKTVDAKVLLKMIEFGNGRQQAGFILRYVNDTSDCDIDDPVIVVRGNEAQAATSKYVNLVYDMTSYQANDGQHKDNWCDVSFVSGTKKKDMTLLFDDAETMRMFRGAAIALQTSLSISRLTPEQKISLQNRLNAQKASLVASKAVARVENIEGIPDTAPAKTTNDTTKSAVGPPNLASVKAEDGTKSSTYMGAKNVDPDILPKDGVEKSVSVVVEENGQTSQSSPRSDNIKYSRGALRSMSNTSTQVTPPLENWQYTESVLKGGRLNETPKAAEPLKQASMNASPMTRNLDTLSTRDEAWKTQYCGQPEIVINFSAPSTKMKGTETRGCKVAPESNKRLKSKATFDFASPPGAPTMPIVVAAKAKPEVEFNFNTLPGSPKESAVKDTRDGATEKFRTASTPDDSSTAEVVAGRTLPTPKKSTASRPEKPSETSQPQMTKTQENHSIPQQAPAVAILKNPTTQQSHDQSAIDREFGQGWSMLSMMNSLSAIDVVEETTTVKTTRRYVLPVGASFSGSGHGQMNVPQPVSSGVVADVRSAIDAATKLSGDAPVFQPSHGGTFQRAPAQGSHGGAKRQQQHKGLANSKYAQPTQGFSHAGQFTGTMLG